MVTREELQRDIGELLDYLHSTAESNWDKQFILNRMFANMNRFKDNFDFYKIPEEEDEYRKLVYDKSDMDDLINILTARYTALGKLELKDEFKEMPQD